MTKKWMGLDPKNLTITGELAFRINRNFSRLEDKMYRPEQIFGADQKRLARRLGGQNHSGTCPGGSSDTQKGCLS